MKYIVTLKENASADELAKAKDTAKSQGGTIVDEYTLIKGFTVDYPKDHVSVLESNEHLTVEADSEMKTQ